MDRTQSPPGETRLEIERFMPANLHEMIQARLMQFISDQQLAAGDRLPSQAALAQALGISMVALREAMRALEALGVIEARAGSGWYVRDFSFDAVARGLAYSFQLNRRNFGDLLDVRVRLECSYLPEVMTRLTEADLAGLERAVDEMEALATSGQAFDTPDRAFHIGLFSGKVQNEIFTDVLEMFWTLFPRIASSGRLNREALLSHAQSHRLILEAMRQGDANLAVQRLMESLQGAIERAEALPLEDSQP